MDFNGAFDPENKFWMFMEKVMNLFFVGILWLIFSLPIVTIGAATTAVFQYTLRLTEDEEGYVWRTFSRSFVKNLIPATVLWIGVMATAWVFWFYIKNLLLLPLPKPAMVAAYFFVLCLGFLWLITVLWIFPILSFFKVGIKKAIKDAFVMAVGNLYVSITILVIYVLIVGIGTYFVFELAVAWFAIATFVASFFYRNTFKRYMVDEEPMA